MAEFSFHEFSNPGYLLVKFTDEELYPVKEEINKIQKDFSKASKHNEYLAGQIEHEYKLTDCQTPLHNLVVPYVHEYERRYNFLTNANKNWSGKGVQLKQAWVNFQKKYEFNPWHDHSGVMSFVIWISVPYSFDKENATKTGMPTKGAFSLLYTNSLGKQCTKQIPVDESYENTMLLFPSNFMHQVFPFYTSNKYRISVSGNFWFVDTP